jgi:hypothetical protein
VLHAAFVQSAKIGFGGDFRRYVHVHCGSPCEAR